MRNGSTTHERRRKAGPQTREMARTRPQDAGGGEGPAKLRAARVDSIARTATPVITRRGEAGVDDPPAG